MRSTYLFSILAAFVLAACSSDSSSSDDANEPDGSAGSGNDSPDAGGGGSGSDVDAGDASFEESPAISVLTRVCTPDDCLHYLFFMPELPADGKLDRSKGVESGETQGTVFNGAAYIFDREASSVTRWTADADLKPVEGKTVSFQGTSVTQTPAITNIFASPTRAFLLDGVAGVIVTWDPTAMKVIATTNIPEEALERDGLQGEFIWPTVVGNRAFFDAYYYDYDNREFYPKVAVLSFDVREDEPEVEIIEDDRCGASTSTAPFADEEGNVYILGDWFAGLAQVGVSPAAPNPACLLRIKPDAREFDPDYYVDLLDVSGANAVHAGFHMGGNKLLLNIWPESEPAPTEEEITADPDVFWSGTFEFTVLDLETGDATLVSDLEPAGAGNMTPLRLDGVNYVQAYERGDDDSYEAHLFEVKQDASAQKVLSAGLNGDFEMIGRLR